MVHETHDSHARIQGVVRTGGCNKCLLVERFEFANPALHQSVFQREGLCALHLRERGSELAAHAVRTEDAAWSLAARPPAERRKALG